MDREKIAQFRATLARISGQSVELIRRVPRKARIILGLFFIAAILLAIYTAVSAKDSVLHVKVQHGFHNAAISIWVDGSLAYSGTVAGAAKKKFGFLPSDSVQGSLSQMIPLRSGQHTVRVRVAPDDGAAQDDSITGDFGHNSERELSVAARHSGLALTWVGSGAAEAEVASGSGWISRYAGSLLLSVAGSIVSAITGIAIRELPGRFRSTSDSTPKAG